MRRRNLYPFITRIKEKSNLREYASQYTDLDRRGRGLCPFNFERTPSFNVNKKNGIWLFHCFGCGVGGTIIDFVMEEKGLSKWKSIEYLADYYQIRPPRTEKERRSVEKKFLYQKEKRHNESLGKEVERQECREMHEIVCGLHRMIIRKKNMNKYDFAFRDELEYFCGHYSSKLSAAEKGLRRI